MASKKARAKKKSVSKGRASTGGKGKGGQHLLRTRFMADFTKAFIGHPKNWLWPVPGQFRNDVANDYATFVNVLMTVGYVKGPPPAATSGSLGDRIGQFLIAQKWPNETKVPREYEKERTTVHLVEIAVILDRLLCAINYFKVVGEGSGGGPGGWPPH